METQPKFTSKDYYEANVNETNCLNYYHRTRLNEALTALDDFKASKQTDDDIQRAFNYVHNDLAKLKTLIYDKYIQWNDNINLRELYDYDELKQQLAQYEMDEGIISVEDMAVIDTDENGDEYTYFIDNLYGLSPKEEIAYEYFIHIIGPKVHQPIQVVNGKVYPLSKTVLLKWLKFVINLYQK